MTDKNMLEIIAEKNDFTKIFYSGCKTEQNIGLEYEKLAVYSDTMKAVTYPDIVKILLAMENSDRTIIFEDKNPMGMIMEQGHISLEPGSQFEISLNPVKNISDIKRMLDEYNAETEEIAEKLGFNWLSTGIQPISTFDDITIIPKHRYKQMTEYLPKKARLPFVMMRETAGIQVGFDYTDEEDSIRKLSVALKLSPVVSAIFSNSPVRNLKLTGCKSFRAYSWLNTDEDRCGLISKKIFHNDFSFDDYRDFLFNIPMIFIVKDNKYISTGNMTFGEYYKNGFDGYYPTIEDWYNHLSLFFPDVRLKSYLEIRNHDSQRYDLITSVPAFWKGILYNKDALNAVDDLFKNFEFEDFEELRFIAPDLGLDAQFKKFRLYDWAKEILNISKQSLETMKTGEERYLMPIINYVSKNMTPADEIIDRLKPLDTISVKDIKFLENHT